MLLWHLGATTALARYAFRDEAMDLRFLLLGAVLPDLLDTPVGLAAWERFHAVRLWSHSIAFAAVVMVVVLVATRRGPSRRRWMPLAIGVLLHLVLDGMWRQQETLWWPFLGTAPTPTGFATAGEWLRWLASHPATWAGELLGGAYLVVLAVRSRLGDRDRLREFLAHGRVRAPIGRRPS